MSQQPNQSVTPERWRPSGRLILWVAVIVLAVVFISQNSGHGSVNLLFWDVSAPAWLWLVLLFLAGVVVGSIRPWLRRSRKE